MFALSTKFRASRKSDGAGTLLYLIRDGERALTIPTGLRITGKDMVYRFKGEISFGLKSIYCVIDELTKMNGSVTIDKVVEKSAEILNGHNPYTDLIYCYGHEFPVDPDIAKISNVYKSEFVVRRRSKKMSADCGLLEYTDSLVVDYNNDGRKVAQSYRSSSGCLSRFMNGRDRPICSIDTEFVSAYGRFLGERVSSDTVAFYMRVLRSTLNHARKAGWNVPEPGWPMKIDVSPYSKPENPDKKSLDRSLLRKIESLELSRNSDLVFVRDLFMFSFYAQGVELRDLANLKVKDVEGDCLRFHRRSHGRLVDVRLGAKALEIISRYHEAGSDYLFPLLSVGGRPYSFDKVKADTRKAMRAIGQLLDPPRSLTFGMSRSSWLAISQEINISETILR